MWSLAGSQALDQPIQPSQCSRFGLGSSAACGSSSFVLGLGAAGRSSCFGLERLGRGSPGTESLGTRVAVWGLWVEQLASAPDALPPEVSGVGTPLPGFHVWAPSSLLCVLATGLQVSAGAAYPAFTVQRQSGEGLQGPRLLPRVL